VAERSAALAEQAAALKVREENSHRDVAAQREALQREADRLSVREAKLEERAAAIASKEAKVR
jgi:hypothetical protein